MIENDYWEQFKQTGKVYDYLAFKFSDMQENINGENVDANNNGRCSNS